MSITNGKTIIITGKYDNYISTQGEIGTVQFIPSVSNLSDTVDSQFITTPPVTAYLPGTVGGSPNSSGPGTFSVTVLCTDNTELYPQAFTYTIIERVSNLTRVTKGVKIPSTYGDTVDLTVVLANYI